MGKKVPILYENKEDCCGCGACVNICPRAAIYMEEDECGFLYPRIDENKCVRCQRCKTVCAFQNIEEKNVPLKTYAAISQNREQANQSASGGIFAAIATQFIEAGGIVFGASFSENYGVSHRAVGNIENLFLLQGSKYVQSRIDNTYQQAKDYLEKGKKVLFSGTPCQIAGLMGFLGKEYTNLLTVDIVCHGVPSEKIFLSYFSMLERKYEGKIKYFTFRDKKIGWGINGKVVLSLKNKKTKSVKLWQSGSSYLYYFIKGWLYRENCYRCKYAGKNRPGDITLGDYWGIEKQHPEYLNGADGWDESNGISVVIANTSKGLEVLNEIDGLEMRSSTFEKAAYGNKQLMHPSEKGKRQEILEQYRIGGWDALENRYQKKIGIRKYASQVKALIPLKIKRWLKGRI